MTTTTYGPWTQDPDWSYTAIETALFGTSGASWDKVQTFDEHSSGIVPSQQSDARACCWAHAVDGDNGSDSDGVHVCSAVVINRNRTTLSGIRWDSSSTLIVGDDETWSIPLTSLGADYQVNALQGVSTADPNRFGLDPRTGITWPDPLLPPSGYDGYEYESTQATIIAFTATITVAARGQIKNGFDLQVRRGVATDPVVFTPPAFVDHASTAALALLASVTVPAGTADGTSIGSLVVDFTSEYVPVTRTYFPLLISTDRLASLLTPDADDGVALSGHWFNTANVTVQWAFTLRPPRWRTYRIGPVPPLRQYQRDDELAGGPGRQSITNRSLQSRSARTSWSGSYL